MDDLLRRRKGEWSRGVRAPHPYAATLANHSQKHSGTRPATEAFYPSWGGAKEIPMANQQNQNPNDPNRPGRQQEQQQPPRREDQERRPQQPGETRKEEQRR